MQLQTLAQDGAADAKDPEVHTWWWTYSRPLLVVVVVVVVVVVNKRDRNTSAVYQAITSVSSQSLYRRY
jgi:hypothetical protein